MQLPYSEELNIEYLGYDNGVDMVIIDDNICEHNEEEPVFSYMLITDILGITGSCPLQ